MENKSNNTSQHVLTESGEILLVQTLISINRSEWENTNNDSSRNKSDKDIFKRFGYSRDPPDNWVNRRRNTGDKY